MSYVCQWLHFVSIFPLIGSTSRVHPRSSSVIILNCSRLLYADDLNLISNVGSPIDQSNLQTNLDTVSQWCVQRPFKGDRFPVLLQTNNPKGDQHWNFTKSPFAETKSVETFFGSLDTMFSVRNS